MKAIEEMSVIEKIEILGYNFKFCRDYQTEYSRIVAFDNNDYDDILEEHDYDE